MAIRHHQGKVVPFSLGASLRARLFEHEQQFKAQGFEMRGKQDRVRLSSDTRLRQMTAGCNRVTKSGGKRKPSPQSVAAKPQP